MYPVKKPEAPIGVHNDQEENNTTDDTPLQELRGLPVLEIGNNGDSLSSPGEMVQNIVHDSLLLNNREVESCNNSNDIAIYTSDIESVDMFVKQVNEQRKKIRDLKKIGKKESHVISYTFNNERNEIIPKNLLNEECKKARQKLPSHKTVYLCYNCFSEHKYHDFLQKSNLIRHIETVHKHKREATDQYNSTINNVKTKIKKILNW